jgi:hypothetical protein
MSTRAPIAPAARELVPLWCDHSEIVPIVFVPSPWGVLACSRTRVLVYSLDLLTIDSLTHLLTECWHGGPPPN